MNERIRELIQQATKVYEPDWNGAERFEEFNKEKFALLIVRECVGIVTKRKNQAIDDNWNVDEAMSMAEMDLEEHFGVEL